jgi:hypothetical protein
MARKSGKLQGNAKPKRTGSSSGGRKGEPGTSNVTHTGRKSSKAAKGY